MQKVEIQTTHNVSLSYQTASIADRLLASLLDLLIIIAYLFFFFVLLELNESTAIITLLLIPVLGYHLISEIFLNGQSFGKRTMETKVMRLDGSEPNIGNYLMRWMLRLVDISLMGGAIGVLTILFNGQGQRLGDIAAGTTVVKLKDRVELNDVVSKYKIDPNYQPSYPQVMELDDDYMNLVKETIGAYRSTANPKPARLLAKKLKEKLRVESDVTDIKFLHQVLKDYQFYISKK